jgi:two-component system CheB/CheR fusion protein
MTQTDIRENSQSPSHYVAIGASAGGFEALQEFFQHLPVNTGAAYIIIQHLSPDFKSIMAELLNRTANIEALNAVDGVEVEADKIYLIPPRKNMMIAEGRLILSDQMPERGPNFPIDIFFRSLAEDRQHRSIAIILSGTGSDGSRGLQAIKEVGGLVMVQDPNDAKFDGMPYNAVKTGLADIVVNTRKMPVSLLDYMTHPLIAGREQSLIETVENSDQALTQIFELLNKRSENDFTQYKTSTVARRIERRISINQLTNIKDYHSLLLTNPHELSVLAKDLLIGVTRFFRDTDAFEKLEHEVIPEILANAADDESIRIWVAGCSTGEEAYSMAILFDEAIRRTGKGRSVKIFATDVDPDAIAEASNGRYPLNLEEDISPERLSTYFSMDGDNYVIKPSMRQMIVFAVHNLIKDPPFSNIHLATCRNVLIYFQPAAQHRVLSMLHFSLLHKGFLFLGASESLGEIQSHFETQDERAKVFRKTVNTRMPAETNLPNAPSKSPSPGTIEKLMQGYQSNQRASSYAGIMERVLGDYMPPCMLLDINTDILHVYGDINPYTSKIKAGRFSSKITDVVAEDLSIALSTALHRARQEEKDIQYVDVQLGQDDGSRLSITLTVRYLGHAASGNVNLLVLFESPLKREALPSEQTLLYDEGEQRQQRIRDLEQELQKNREHLQVTIEELETTNEELQASNEELLAANEELQSTNEELQSVNEELYSVNSEYQEKIQELSQAYNDVENIMRSTEIGIVLLDQDMMIRSFTSATAEHINVLKSDTGRPFHHISHNLEYPNLLDDIARVLENGRPREYEAVSKNGDILVVKIKPYHDNQDQRDGCLLTLTDITQIRLLESRLYESHQHLLATMGTGLQENAKDITVLVVDNEKIDRDRIAQLLEQIEGISYEVAEVATGDDAITALTNKQYDICLLDYRLNGTDAFEIIARLPDAARTPIVLLSGHISQAVQAQAIELGIYDCIDKDLLTPALLERCIRYTLRHKQSEAFLVNEGRLVIGKTATQEPGH